MTTGNSAAFLQGAQPLPLTNFRFVVVIAPHPDDESLGCGGTIALLRNRGIPVSVIFVSDGSMSHPSSLKYPAQKLVALREEEAVNALAILRVDTFNIHFMRLQDGAVPFEDEPGFDEGVHHLQRLFNRIQPDALFIPWRRDPHRDHRATAAMVIAALANYTLPIQVLEYFVWLWERSEPEDLPLPDEVIIWRVDIGTVAAQKQKAIMAHVSQTTNMIDDDPDGFVLSLQMLAHFKSGVEYFARMKT